MQIVYAMKGIAKSPMDRPVRSLLLVRLARRHLTTPFYLMVRFLF